MSLLPSFFRTLHTDEDREVDVVTKTPDGKASIGLGRASADESKFKVLHWLVTTKPNRRACWLPGLEKMPLPSLFAMQPPSFRTTVEGKGDEPPPRPGSRSPRPSMTPSQQTSPAAAESPGKKEKDDPDTLRKGDLEYVSDELRPIRGGGDDDDDDDNDETQNDARLLLSLGMDQCSHTQTASAEQSVGSAVKTPFHSKRGILPGQAKVPSTGPEMPTLQSGSDDPARLQFSIPGSTSGQSSTKKRKGQGRKYKAGDVFGDEDGNGLYPDSDADEVNEKIDDRGDSLETPNISRQLNSRRSRKSSGTKLSKTPSRLKKKAKKTTDSEARRDDPERGARMRELLMSLQQEASIRGAGSVDADRAAYMLEASAGDASLARGLYWEEVRTKK